MSSSALRASCKKEENPIVAKEDLRPLITDGLKAFHDQLYCTDFNKRHVGVMPIADLRTPN